MDLFRIAPNAFTITMGTGIVAVAAALTPVAVPGLDALATAFWLLAATLLALTAAAAAIAYARAPHGLRGHLLDPASAPFFGALPMAALTVGAATLLAGRHVIGAGAALPVAAVLWAVGTAGAVAVAVAIPYIMVTRHDLAPRDASGTWLLPLVGPLVSAATGAALVPHVPAGELRADLLLALYALFGVSLLAALITIMLLWARLLFHGPVPAHATPALWMALGPLGTSVTAANLLGAAAPHALDGPYAPALEAFGLVYGVPAYGFALLWLALAAALTARAARAAGGLPFGATWWAFTFPLGTVVTATATLADRTGSHALAGAAVVLLAALLMTWATVAGRTATHVFARARQTRARAVEAAA